MHRSTSTVRRACAVGTTVALIGLTTGLGIMTATSASAAEADPSATNDATTTSAPSATTEDAAPDTETTGSDTTGDQTTGDDAAGSDAAGSGSTPADDAAQTPPAGDAGETSGTPASTPATPSALSIPQLPSGTATTAAAPARTYTATIIGEPKVGSTLSVQVSGFDAGTSYRYSWTDEDGTVLSTTSTYPVTDAVVGQQITVVVTGALPGETATDTTDTPVSETPVFVDAAGDPITEGTTQDEPLALSGAAGEAFSYTFHATGSPAPELSLAWFSGEDESDPDDPDYTPASQLPDGFTFDPATGVLSGTTDAATWYDFAVTATSGTAHATQYVELTVDPAAPLGIQVYTGDRDALASDSSTSWVIDTDGSVYTVHSEETDDGASVDVVPGGRPTVEQGGTLFVAGSLVDRYGNDVSPVTDDGDIVPPTVTSDFASDVIAADPDFGDYGVVDVTFPHASVHTLNVASGSFSTSFAVEVQPAATTVTTGTNTLTGTGRLTSTGTESTGARRLAYTGTDSTSALPWALGLVLAGAGLIGARTLRRRRAQR